MEIFCSFLRSDLNILHTFKAFRYRNPISVCTLPHKGTLNFYSLILISGPFFYSFAREIHSICTNLIEATILHMFSCLLYEGSDGVKYEIPS